MTSHDDRALRLLDPDDGEQPGSSAAEAAAEASRDAEEVAKWAADATATAFEAVVTADEVATSAREATAVVVAAAAVAAAETAARAASAVQSEAAAQAVEVAASAARARMSLEADLASDVDAAVARRVAGIVASAVAAAVVTQARLTESAAVRVERAVALAAEAAAMAAVAAATLVDEAIGDAAVSANRMVGSNAATAAASDLAVESTARSSVEAQRSAGMLPGVPLERELEAALDRDELRLHYQPMYSMETGAMIAVEALLRWEHPSRGLLPPSEFIDVAEGPRLVLPVGDWVLHTAVAQALEWQRFVGSAAPRIWVNISCDQLGRQHLPGVVQDVLSTSGLDPSRLGIEITERQLARRADAVASDLVALRGLEVGLAVDDFGTGYASLDYLRMCTFDEIKIDRSFVSGLDTDRTDTAVISSIIALGSSLDLSVVAEGVETPDQYTRLRQMGCTVSQGYLHHRPAPAGTVTALLLDSPGGHSPPV